MDKKTQKPDKREYTLKIIPHQGGDVRSIRLPIRAIKYGVAVICASAVLFIGAFGYSTYNASLLKQDQAELDELRQVNNIQQTQILQLAKKAATLQEDMDKLDELESELRQLTATNTDTETSRSGVNRLEHDGQGGPVIKPNIDNLNETLTSLEERLKVRKANLEALKANLVTQQAQLAVTPSIWPANGEVSSRYGLRWGGSDFHPGVDIAADTGTPVVATADGVVVESGWNSGGYGYMVDIDHGNGVVTRYGHNSQLAVSVGTAVKKGQVIAYMGSTGFSTGPHVHYEVIVNGKPVNPDRYL
ncbi:M23 family metallopeptidase [Anaerosinus massiliensis]|uniref:M23 family metallopeptidase n=1 Tax=Massilibacillus massiliensis TaxID=1806837 RepID=UPI000DA6004C|nr:M23 family metallopeptidase [Massilibacillus massiliensis]